VLPHDGSTGPRAFIRELGMRLAASVTRLGRSRGKAPSESR
jgi:hypothetical protein